MSDILNEINSEEYQKKLLQAWIASRIAYNDELVSEGQLPEIKDYEKNYSKFDHGIEKIISSKDYTKTIMIRIISKHVICECSNKRLIIALTIIKSEEEHFLFQRFHLFKYIKDFDYISWDIRNNAYEIPIDHLIDKLIEGYELVFTGYSFGAALAAFLAIRVLLRNITKKDCVQIDDLNRVSFIGFGCPLFLNAKFQKFIKNKRHEDKFYFYRHENDLNFFDLGIILQKLRSSSSESKNTKFKINRSIYRRYKRSKEDPKFFLDYLKRVESLKFSDSEFKQPFVEFGHNLKISSTGNKIKLNKFENYYNIETLKSKIESIEYNFNINDYFKDYFKVSIEQKQKYKTISYLDEFKIGRTFEYLFYPDYSRIHYKNVENTDHNEHFTVIINQPCIDSVRDVLLGIYNSERLYLKTVIGFSVHTSDNIERIYSDDLKTTSETIWYQFKPTEKIITGDQVKLEFTLYTLYEEILIKPPETIIEIELEHSLYFDKKICSAYKLSLELLYIHAFFFIYLVNKSGEQNGQIFNNYKKIIENFDILDKELKRQSIEDIEDIEDKERKELCDESINVWLEGMEAILVKCLSSFFYMKRAIVNLVKTNPKFLWTLNVDNISSKSQIHDIKKSEFRKAMCNFKVDREADLKYIYALKELEKENRIQCLGFYEEKIRDNREILRNQQMEEVFFNKSLFLNSVVSNFNIREALVNSCLIGIEGDKKAGKSTFVNSILKESRNLGSASIETNEMSAYQFSKDIDMLLVDYPHYNSTDEFYALQFEYSKYILDYTFVVCDAMQVGNTSKIFGALNDLGVNRCCVIMNKFDDVINDIEECSSHFLAKFLHEKKNFIISELEGFNRGKYFQTDREELEKNLLIIPTCLTESNDPEIQYKYQRAGIFFGEDLKKKLLETIHDNIKNEHVKLKLKDYYAKENITKKCRFITKLNNKTIYKDIDINKGDEYNRIIERISETFEGIGDSLCIKPELSDPNSDLIISIDGFFNNKGFVFIVEKNNEKECAFVMKKYQKLLEVTINKDKNSLNYIEFEELQLDLKPILRGKLKLKNLETFWIKPQLSLNSPELITSIDGFFNTKGFDFIVEIYKECFFEMKQHSELNCFKLTINEDISFDELKRRIKEHFELDKSETFWIKPNPSETILLIDGLFQSNQSNFIVEIYKECVFEMKQHSELNCFKLTINEDISFDELKSIIIKKFNLQGLQGLARLSIKPKTEGYSSSITSIDGFFKSIYFTFKVEI